LEDAENAINEHLGTSEETDTWYVSTTYGSTWSGMVSKMRDDYSYDCVQYFATEEEADAEALKRRLQEDN
jgi:C1A family cysteine protease